MDVQKTLEVIDDVGNIAVNAILLLKKGIGLGSFGLLMELANNVKELVVDAPLALPELMDLDAVESGKIGQAAFGMVNKVLAALKA